MLTSGPLSANVARDFHAGEFDEKERASFEHIPVRVKSSDPNFLPVTSCLDISVNVPCISMEVPTKAWEDPLEGTPNQL
jgi:hypothetical protein